VRLKSSFDDIMGVLTDAFLLNIRKVGCKRALISESSFFYCFGKRRWIEKLSALTLRSFMERTHPSATQGSGVNNH
jgi:hypothetical protein